MSNLLFVAQIIIVIISTQLYFVLSSDSNPTTNTTTTTTAHEWNYLKNGEDWEGTCAEGESQSPISIEGIKGSCDNAMVFDLKFTTDLIETTITTGHTHKSAGHWSNLYATDIEGKLYGYQAQQFHIHSPAEHIIDGVQYDIELHLVHQILDEFKNDTNMTHAVVAFFFKADDTGQNQFFDIWDISKTTAAFNFSLAKAFNDTVDLEQSYYTYQGSLTTPTCDEVVNWYILPTPLTLSTAQLKNIKTQYQGNMDFAQGNGNNRITMPLNDREVKMGNVACEEQFIYFFSFFILYIFINYFIFKLL